MCGRYTLTMPVDGIRELFKVEAKQNIPARYNVAPGQDISAVVNLKNGNRALSKFNWGLLPSWAKNKKASPRMINARAETIKSKPYFRDAFQNRRCLILADGFYEWKKVRSNVKQPYYIRLNSGIPFCFAGVWERWTNQKREVFETCAIVTTEATTQLQSIHHRMPVILPEAEYETWLTGGIKLVEPLLVSYDGLIETWPVSRLVNNVENDGPKLRYKVEDELIEPLNPIQLHLL